MLIRIFNEASKHELNDKLTRKLHNLRYRTNKISIYKSKKQQIMNGLLLYCCCATFNHQFKELDTRKKILRKRV